MRRFEEREVVVRNYRKKFGRLPNLKNPTTFNEKITYKILYDRRPILTRLQDKLQARDYVAQRIGAEYLTELYQVCQSAREIDCQRLPRRFVIKMNHGTGMNIFVTNKSAINVSVIASQLHRWRTMNFYHRWLEWAYRDIRPTIFIEEMLTEESGAPAVNWKFFTFDGRAEFVRIDLKRAGQPVIASYDRRLNRLNFRKGPPDAPTDPVFPRNVDLMFSLAERLGSGLDFVRVDMYNVNGRIVFGEFTLYPGAGLDPFYPTEFDTLFGSKWLVPSRYE